MAQREPASDLPSASSEAHIAVRLHANEAVFLQAAERHGHRGWRHLQPVRQGCGNDRFPFALRLQDSLQVIFFRNRDHCLDYKAKLSAVNWEIRSRSRVSGLSITCAVWLREGSTRWLIANG